MIKQTLTFTNAEFSRFKEGFDNVSRSLLNLTLSPIVNSHRECFKEGKHLGADWCLLRGADI